MEYRTVVSFGVLCVLSVCFASAANEMEKTCRTTPDTEDNAITCYCAYTLYNQSWATCEPNVPDECFPLHTYKAFIIKHDARRVNDTGSEHGYINSLLTTISSLEKDDVYLTYEECLDHIFSSNKGVSQLTRTQTVYSKKTVISIACIACFGGILIGCSMAVLYTKISKYRSERRKNKPQKTTVNAKEMEEEIEKEQLILNDSAPKDLDKLVSESEQMQKVEQNVDKDDEENINGLDSEDAHTYDDLTPFGSKRIRGSLHLYHSLEQPGQRLYMSMESENEHKNNLEGDRANITDKDLAPDKLNMAGNDLNEGDTLVHTNIENQSREEESCLNTDEILDEYSTQDANLYENVGKHSQGAELYENL